MSKFSCRRAPTFDPREALAEACEARSDRPRPASSPIWNHEGGRAFTGEDRAVLLQLAACSLVDERLFYGDTSGQFRILLSRVAREHPEWTVKLAVYLREDLHLRSAAHLVLAHAAAVREARAFVARAFPRVVRRPDDLLEIAALLKDPGHGLGGAIPFVIRRATARKLATFDEVRLLKYRRPHGFGLRHLVRLCHPRPDTARRSFLYRYLLDRRAWARLPAGARADYPTIAAFHAITQGGDKSSEQLQRCVHAGLPWEIVVPHFGSRAEVWRALVPHLPIMALLRNLRNLHECGVLAEDQVRRQVRAHLTDPRRVRKSRQLPFRWLSAYRLMEPLDREVGSWLSTALDHSTANLPSLPGLTVIACDNSASMSWGAISRHSTVRPVDISSLLGAMVRDLCEKSILTVFGSRIEVLEWTDRMSVLDRAQQIAGTDVGHATFAFKIPQILLHLRLRVDRILILTDMQIYGEAGPDAYDEDFTRLLRRYRAEVAPAVRTTVVNLQPNRRFMTPPDENGVTYCAGWSEGILRLAALEEPGSSQVDLVGRVTL